MEQNQLTNLRPLIDGMKGHNYALPDCLKFIFERLNVFDDITFWDIAAVTGDTIAQVYNRNLTTSCEYCVSGYLAGVDYLTYVFDAFGFEIDYSDTTQIDKIVEYIDNGIPILAVTNLNEIDAWYSDVGTHCLIVGYADNGKTLKLLTEGTEPFDYKGNLDLVFIGEKKRDVTLDELYMITIKKMSYWLTLTERNGMYFGAEAYRVWADDIDSGRFDDDNIALWENYGVYVCNLATSSEPTYIFGKSESQTGGRSLLWLKLEELQAGMDMKQVRETMRDKEKRSKVSAMLRDYADKLDEVVELLRSEL